MTHFPPTDLRRQLDNARGKLLNRAAATSIDTQYLIESVAEGRFQETLAEIQTRQVSPDTRPVEELELLVAKRPLLEKHVTTASEFYTEELPSWAKTLYEGTPEEVKAALEQGEGETFVENLREADEVLREAARIAPRLTAPAIGRLTSIVDEESYEAIKRGIDADLATLTKEGTPSYNRVFHATDANGAKLIVKASGNAQKARIEAAATYHLSRDTKLAQYVARGVLDRPIEVHGLSLTIQEEVADTQPHDAHHYMRALAHFHTHCKSILLEHGIVVPEWEAKEFDAILANIDASENPHPWKWLRNRYEDLAGRIGETGAKVLIHGDAKAENLRFGKLLDLEGLKLGDPALDLALYLGTSGIPTGIWGEYLQTYLSVRAKETGVLLERRAVFPFLQRIKEALPIVLLKEYGGLVSRRSSRKWSERQERQQSHLHYLLAA